MALLEDPYCNEFKGTEAFCRKLHPWPKIGPRDGVGMLKLTDFLRACEVAMAINPGLKILEDEHENQVIFQKLPSWLVGRWARQVYTHRREQGRFPPFKDFCSLWREKDRLQMSLFNSSQEHRLEQL